MNKTPKRPTAPAALRAATLALYLTLYAALIVAYVTVLKYMAEKPEEVLADEAREQQQTPPGAITSQVPTTRTA